MYAGNIKTSVNLVNTTIHNVNTNGEAGRVGLIGSFPSMINSVQEHTNLNDLRKCYDIEPGTYKETEFEAARDARRLFMDGIPEYKGASSIISANTCDVESNNKLNLTTLENQLSVTVSGGTVSDEDTSVSKVQDAMKMTYDRLKTALNKMADDDFDMLVISNDLREATDSTHKLTDVYDLIMKYLNEEFTMQRPSYFVGTVQTDGVSDAEGQPSGLKSNEINILGTKKSANSNEYKYEGATQITNKINEVNNELGVAALFYQGGSINGEKVGPGEFAAHMAGWIASLPVSEDLTYKTIPAVDGISEEVYFGTTDAGYILNELGINVVKPKSRKDKTFYVNNSVTPKGWHMNQVRAVSYLLKRYKFEAGLGINNLATQLETFKANLNTITKDVMDKVDIITDVTFDDELTVINHDHITLGLNITVAGVITRIDVGINMSVENPNEVVTVSGYEII